MHAVAVDSVTRISAGIPTPVPVYPGPTVTPPGPPWPMDHHEKMRMRAAAHRATRLYPGPVGELLSREIASWEEFGFRLGGRHLVMRLVDHLMTAPTPTS